MLNLFARHRGMRVATALVALGSLAACYSYVPVTAGALPAAGERVRIALTPQATISLAQYLGPNVTVVDGMLSSVGADSSLMVAVDVVQTSNGVRQQWIGEGNVVVPRGDVLELRQRAFQRNRSIVAATVLTVSLVGIAIIALRSGGAGGGGAIPPPPPP